MEESRFWSLDNNTTVTKKGRIDLTQCRQIIAERISKMDVSKKEEGSEIRKMVGTYIIGWGGRSL